MPNSAGVEVARISVKVSPDTRQFRRDLKSDLEAIEKEMKGDIEVKAHLGAGQAKADMHRLMAQLKAEGAKGVDVKVGIDKTLGARINEFERLGRTTQNFGQAAKNMSAFGEGASFLSKSPDMTWGAVFVAIGALAAPAIGLVAGLLAGLPSLIMAAAVPMGAIALGLDGIKKAADEAGLTSSKKGKNGKTKTSLGEALQEVQSKVSEVFATGLVPVIEQLMTLLPAMTTGFVGVAQSLVGMAGQLTNVLTSAQGMQQIQDIFGGVKTFLDGMSPVLATFTQTFLTLSAEGAKNFSKLIAPLAQFSQQFNDMINRVAGNGVLSSAFEGLSQTLGGLLDLFTRLFESGLQAMGQLGGPLNTFLKGLGDLVVSLMPALTSLSALFGNVLGELGSQLAPIITELTPGFTMLADTIGTLLVGALRALGPLLTPIATSLSNLFVGALQQLQPVLPSIIASFVKLGNALGGALAQYLPQLATAFGQLIGVIAQQQPMMIGSLVDALAAMVPILPTIAPALTQVATAFSNLMVAIGPQLPVIVKGIADAIIAFVPTLPQVTPLITQMGTAFAQLIGQVGPYIPIMAQVTAQMGAVAAIITTQVLTAIMQFGAALAGAIADFAQFVQSVITGVGQVLSEIGQLPGKVKAFFADAGTWLIEAGKNVIKGFIDGIKSMVGAVKDAVGSVIGGIKNLIPHSPAKEGPFSGSGWLEILTGGQALGEQFGKGLENGMQSALDVARDMAAKISQAMKDGTDVSGALSGFSSKDLKRGLAALEQEKKRLKVQKDALPKGDKEGRKALQNQIDQLQAQKDLLSYQKDRIKNEKEYGDKAGDDPLVKAAAGLMASPVNFAKATGKQFLSDIGISGEGIISKALTEGIQYVFHIGSVDEALSIKDREESKSALAVVGRQ